MLHKQPARCLCCFPFPEHHQSLALPRASVGLLWKWPCAHIKTFYTHFCEFDHELLEPGAGTGDAAEESVETTAVVEQSVTSTVHDIGDNLQLAKLSSLSVDGIADVRPLFRYISRALPKIHESVFRINLPGGTNLEFETVSPEWFANRWCSRRGEQHGARLQRHTHHDCVNAIWSAG